MKTLKFKPELCKQILSGEKTATWRLYDDKDLRQGDEIQLVNKETGSVIGAGVILKLKVTTLGGLEEQDWVGHERYSSEDEMYATYKMYYGEKVGPDSDLKIIDFSFQPV